MMPIDRLMDGQSADDRGVINFGYAMACKLRSKRNEGKRGWHDPHQCSIRRLRKMLREHIEKGDMVDIGNFAMMVWNREQMQ